MAAIVDRIHLKSGHIAVLGTLLLCCGCGASEEPTATTRLIVGDAARGRAAFVTSCSGCHTTRDAFDIAHFGFASSDIVRRALAHVSRQTAEDIAAYVRSLGIQAVGRDARPFQPGKRVLASDAEFWQSTFGTSGWPANLTPAALRAIDPRRLSVPIALPRWSSEADESDWLPETPLSEQLLGAQNGVLRSAIDAYYAAPTQANLLAAIATFVQVTNGANGSLCYGEAGNHTQPRECFEARRWMAALAAQHFLRPGAGALPIEVMDLFWSTGEAAVTVYQRERGHPYSIAWGWLYLAYSFAPTRFKEDNGYLGQFLQSDRFEWLATFTALRRMVDENDVHSGLAAQRFWDAALAVNRAPFGQKGNVAEFAYPFLLDWLTARTPLDSAAREQAKTFLKFTQDNVLQDRVEQAQLDRLTSLQDQLLARLR